MKENIEEDMKRLERISKYFNYHMWEDDINSLAIILSDYKRVLKENEQLKQMLDERFIYVTGARTVYARLMQLDKEIIVKDNLKRRNEIKQLLKENKELKETNKVISIELTKDKVLQQDCLRTVCGVPIGEIPKILRENEELKHKYDKALSDVIAGVDLDNTYIPKQKIKDKIEELNKKEKQELKGTKGQDRYSIKQQYMYQKNILQDLLESEGK